MKRARSPQPAARSPQPSSAIIRFESRHPLAYLRYGEYSKIGCYREAQGAEGGGECAYRAGSQRDELAASRWRIALVHHKVRCIGHSLVVELRLPQGGGRQALIHPPCKQCAKQIALDSRDCGRHGN